jgi:hypothetical protein
MESGEVPTGSFVGGHFIQTKGRLSSDYASASVEVQNEILTRQANICAEEQRKNARGMLNVKGYSRGVTAGGIKVTSPFVRDGVRAISIKFLGSRPNGKGTKSVAEVAFFNEFGIGDSEGGMRMSKRNFIAKSNEDKADECAEVAADTFAQYVSDQLIL